MNRHHATLPSDRAANAESATFRKKSLRTGTATTQTAVAIDQANVLARALAGMAARVNLPDLDRKSRKAIWSMDTGTVCAPLRAKAISRNNYPPFPLYSVNGHLLPMMWKQTMNQNADTAKRDAVMSGCPLAPRDLSLPSALGTIRAATCAKNCSPAVWACLAANLPAAVPVGRPITRSAIRRPQTPKALLSLKRNLPQRQTTQRLK